MPNNDQDILATLYAIREDVAEMRVLMQEHAASPVHHLPPCVVAEETRRTILAAAGAALLSLLAAVGALAMTLVGG